MWLTYGSMKFISTILETISRDNQFILALELCFLWATAV